MSSTEAYGARMAWRYVIILTLLNIISYLDRYAVALLADPISKALQLSDTDLALIIGLGFALVYSCVSLPLSNVIDRWNRTWIVVGAVTIWSGSTILAGFVDSFALLAVTRAGVALGEAALVPAAVSLIADLFPPEKRIAPMSIFSSVAGYMGKASFIVGAGLLTVATALSAHVGLVPWRLTMVLMGVPGLVLVLALLASVREPKRVSHASEAAAQQMSLGDFLRHVRRNWAFYIPLLIGISGTASFAIGMISWTSTLLVRAHGFSVAQAALLFGVIGMGFGVAGSIFWPWLVARLTGKGRRDAILTGLLIAQFMFTPFTIFGPMSPSTVGLLVGVAGIQFAFAATGVLTPLIAQRHGFPAMRARLMSLQLIAMSFVGFIIGPLAVAELAKLWDGNPAALGYGMSVLGAVVAPISIVSIFVSRRTLLRDWQRIQG